jgi:tight adherence protein B
MDSFYPILIFIAVLILIELGYFALGSLRFPERKEVRKRLKVLSAQSDNRENVDILKKEQLSDILWLHRILKKFSSISKTADLIEQSGSQRTPGFFILISLSLGAAGFLLGSKFQSSYYPLIPSYFINVPAIFVLAIIPFAYLRYKRSKRLHKFEEQLPEALDLIARSLKAGHAFSSGLRLVSEEMEDPVRNEFGKTLNEINFGVAAQDALINMANRIPLDDLKFFVISVILQRETGGNLADILESLARLIRERFKLHGRVRVLSAQARFSSYVLAAIPFVVALILYLMSPQFYDPFFENPMGRYILGFGVVWMIIGFIFMKKLVTIRV